MLKVFLLASVLFSLVVSANQPQGTKKQFTEEDQKTKIMEPQGAIILDQSHQSAELKEALEEMNKEAQSQTLKKPSKKQ